MAEARGYRFARADEIAGVARLVAHSFPGVQRQQAWWEEQLRGPRYGGGAETLWIGEESGRTVAACQLHRLQQWIGGELFACAGVGTVAIAPTHRRRGLGAELVATALRAAHERGDVVSALYPFRSSFYARLGYGHADQVLQYLVPPDALSDAPERHRVEVLDGPQAHQEALQLYNGWARGQTGQLQRTERMWSGVFGALDQALVGYRGESGALEGYALVVYRTDLPPHERYLEVDELVWTSPEARRGLYGWLASLGDQWRHLLVRALPSHRFTNWIAEPRMPRGAAPSWRLYEPAATLLLGTMIRLLDVNAAWQNRRVAAGPTLVVTVEVSDRQIAENAGSRRLVLENGRVSVDREGAADLTLRLDVSVLSRLFVGALAATAAAEAGLLQCDRPDRLTSLDDALALPEAWTFDRF